MKASQPPTNATVPHYRNIEEPVHYTDPKPIATPISPAATPANSLPMPAMPIGTAADGVVVVTLEEFPLVTVDGEGVGVTSVTFVDTMGLGPVVKLKELVVLIKVPFKLLLNICKVDVTYVTSPGGVIGNVV